MNNRMHSTPKELTYLHFYSSYQDELLVIWELVMGSELPFKIEPLK